MNYGIIFGFENDKRIRNETHKYILPLLNKPMIEYPIDVLKKANLDSIICVIDHEKEVFEELLKDKDLYIIQEEKISTANAKLIFKNFNNDNGYSDIVPGDKPLLDTEMINNLIKSHLKNNNELTVGIYYQENSKDFCRFLHNERLDEVHVIAKKNAINSKNIKSEVDSRIYCINNSFLFEIIENVQKNSDKHESYLSDIVKILSLKHKVSTYTFDEPFR